MKQIEFAATGRTTTQLGFGCSSLMSATGKKESLALLEHAFDVGIRHFDVAPMYGYGAAERCLGQFLARHPGQITVTTKYGIPPPGNQGLMQAARSAARPFFRLFPGIKKRFAGAGNAVTMNPAKARFTAQEARTSLDHSLRLLQVDRIDLWLLHEAEAPDLQHDDLLRFMQDSLDHGKIAAYGVGSSAEKIPALLTHKAAYCHVLQFQWSILDKPLDPQNAFTIHHRALTANFADLRSALENAPQVRKRWSNEVGADLAQPGMLAALMLKAALVLNPESIILVSSKDLSHIRENVSVAENDQLIQPARELFRVAQQEAATVLSRG